MLSGLLYLTGSGLEVGCESSTTHYNLLFE